MKKGNKKSTTMTRRVTTQRLDVAANDMVRKIKLMGRPEGETGPSRHAKMDGWTNALAGLGKAQDKQRATKFGDYVLLVRDELSRMYVGDGMGGRIVDVVPDDMTREWIKIETDDQELDELLADALDVIGAENAFNIALKWKRLFGGSVIIIGVMDGQELEFPVNPKTAKSIEWLKPVDMYDIDLISSEWERDPTSKMFGKIIKYAVDFRTSGIGSIQRKMVHFSRVLEFHGESVPASVVLQDQRLRYWGASIIQRIWDSLRNYGGVMSSVTNLLYEFVIGKFKFENLGDMLLAGQEGVLVKRMEIINMSKSILNAVLLGKNEEYTRDSATVAGIAELMDRFMIALSGTTGIPVTKLFGRSPAGLNATGESDLDNYYDDVRSGQKNHLKAPIMKLLQLMTLIAGKNTVPSFEFNSLQQLSETEQVELEGKKSTVYKTNADADMVYLEMGAITVDDIITNRGFDEENAGGGDDD